MAQLDWAADAFEYRAVPFKTFRTNRFSLPTHGITETCSRTPSLSYFSTKGNPFSELSDASCADMQSTDTVRLCKRCLSKELGKNTQNNWTTLSPVLET